MLHGEKRGGGARKKQEQSERKIEIGRKGETINYYLVSMYGWHFKYYHLHLFYFV
jgi:hypothetical protein